MHRHLFRLVGTVALAFTAQLAVAANVDEILYSYFSSLQTYPYVVSVSAGELWTLSGKTQTLVLAPEIEKTYKAAKHVDGIGVGDVFIGLQHALPNAIDGQIGLAYAFSGWTTLRGHIWDDADPEFDNFRYKYKVRHSHIALKGKLATNWCYPVQPWISASVGVGFNRAFHFVNSPLIPEALPNPNFSSHAMSSFTYTLGVGLERQYEKHWLIGAGYEFSDWGRNRLSRADGQTNGHGLALSHLYTQGLTVNVSYANNA